MRIIMISILILLFVSPSVIRPKLSIETPVSIEQKQYQNNDEPLVIETPAPRTETLDGFRPLGGN